MTKLAMIWFLVAGLVGAVGGYGDGTGRWYGRSLAWAIVALMAFLGLVGAIVL